jgi:hypothetical protein
MKNDYKFPRCYHTYILSNYKYFAYLFIYNMILIVDFIENKFIVL